MLDLQEVRFDNNWVEWALMFVDECKKANGPISTDKLHVLPRFHPRPINVVVYHESHGENSS